MAVYRRGKTYWYEFTFAGQRIREPSKSRSKMVAVAAERARRRELEQSFNRIERREQVPLFKRAAQHWLESKTGLAEKTTVTLEGRVAPLRKHFGDRLICDIGVRDVAEYQAKRVAAGYSGRTVNMEVGCLRGILKLYGLWWPIADRIKSYRERHDVGRAISVQDEQKLLSACQASRNPALYALCVLSIDTGLRAAEMKSLRWRDLALNWRDGIIVGGEVIVPKSKTDAGTGRSVPLTRRACAVLTAWAARFSTPCDTDYVFPRHRVGIAGNTHDPKMWAVDVTRPIREWKSAWKQARTVAGVSCRWHDLRHTFVSRLAENPAISEGTLTALAGHVSRQMLQRYSHIRNEAKKQAIASLDQQQTAAIASAESSRTGRPN